MLKCRRSVLLVIAFVVQAGTAQAANLCDDLWLSRNAAFDSAGFCFRSPLGQALFDNKDCRAGAPVFDDAQQEVVAQVVETENKNACSVDTNRRSLDVDALESRKRLTRQPVAMPTGRQCLGYIGPVTRLRVAPAPDTDELSSLEPGAVLIHAHQLHAGWSYVTLEDPDGLIAGWIPGELDTCEAWTDWDWDQ